MNAPIRENHQTPIEAQYHEHHEQFVERGRAMLERFQGVQQRIEGVAQRVEELLAAREVFQGESYDEMNAHLEASLEALEQELQAIEQEYAQFLTEWEEIALDTLSMYDVTVVELPFERTFESNLAVISGAMQARTRQLSGAHWLVRTCSRAHKRAVAQLQAHERIVELIREAVADLQTDQGVSSRQGRRSLGSARESAREVIDDRLYAEAQQRTAEIVEQQEQLYALAGSTELHDRINARLREMHIQPIVDELLERHPGLEPQIRQWEQAVVALLTNDGNSRHPDDLRIGGERVQTFNGWEDRAGRALTDEFPRRPGDRFMMLHDRDRELRRAVEWAPSDIDRSNWENPNQQTRNLLRLFADWRAHRDFNREVVPYDRPTAAIKHQRRSLRDDAIQHVGNNDELIKILRGTQRIRLLRDDPEVAAIATDEEFEEFEEFLIETLMRDMIRPGGRESGHGTDAAMDLGKLGNPKAIEPLLEHIFYAGSGHTTVLIFSIIRRLAQSEEGRAHLEAMPGIERALIAQMVDEDSVLYQETSDVYGRTRLLSKGEFFVARAQLADLFSDTEVPEMFSFMDMPERSAFVAGLLPDGTSVGILLRQREEVERRVLEARDMTPWWTIHGLTAALAANPEFMEQIGQEAIGQEEGDAMDNFRRLLAHKKVRRSHQSRGILLQGFLRMRAQGEQGAAVLQDMMQRYRDTRDDPRRVREMFRSFEMLERFGCMEYDYDPTERLEAIRAALANIELILPRLDPPTRKAIRTRRRALIKEEQELTGLVGPTEHYRDRVATVLTDRLGVSAEIGHAIADNIDAHDRSGFLDMSTTLLLSFEAKKVDDPVEALRSVIEHHVVGDFASWKYTHECAEDQIGFLGDQREHWIETEDAVQVERSDEEQDLLEQQRSAALGLLDDADAHFAEFTADRTDDDAVTAIARQLAAVREQLTATPLERGAVLRMAMRLQQQCEAASLHQVASDVNQLYRPFTVSEVGTVTAEEFDDELRMIRLGTEPSETCQSWKRGAYNECLLSYVVDANKKGINVRGEEGEILLRCVERITQIRETNTEGEHPTLFLEPAYKTIDHPRVYQAFAQLAFNKAESCGASVSITPHVWCEQALQAFYEEAARRGATVRGDTEENKGEERDMYIARTQNEYQYSDSFGGKLSDYNTYRRAAIMEFVLPSAEQASE